MVSFTTRPLRPRYPLDRRLGGPQSRSGWRVENSWPYRDWNSDPSVVQHVANHYTDCAIPATYIPCYNHLLINVKKNSLTVVINTIPSTPTFQRNMLISCQELKRVLLIQINCLSPEGLHEKGHEKVLALMLTAVNLLVLRVLPQFVRFTQQTGCGLYFR
jgi:hypothetical protein